MWQVADIGLAEADEHRLFEAPSFEQIKLLSDLNGGDPDRIKAWEQANHAIVNFGHLREANTYAWRGDSVSLATLVDHRFGQMRDQVHAWQAADRRPGAGLHDPPGPRPARVHRMGRGRW